MYRLEGRGQPGSGDDEIAMGELNGRIDEKWETGRGIATIHWDIHFLSLGIL